MPYTALQTLGWLATRSKWERAFNVNRAFLRYVQQQQGSCRLVIGRKELRERRRRARSGRRDGLVVVFKAVAVREACSVTKKKPEKEKKGKGRKGLDGEKEADVPWVKGHMGCGGLDCTVCQQLWGLFCGEVGGGGAERVKGGKEVDKADDGGQGSEVSEREIVDTEDEGAM